MPRVLSIDVGIKNLSYCVIDANHDCVLVTDWKNVCITDKNCKKVKVEQVTECMLETLMEHFADDFQADIVLIENQPMLKNGLMKTVAVIIYTYFNMLKIMHGNVGEVKFISASNKLKQNTLTPETQQAPQALQSKTTYKERKNLSICLARQQLDTVAPMFKEWFENQSKKDDCSDALNQGLYYISHVLKFPLKPCSKE